MQSNTWSWYRAAEHPSIKASAGNALSELWRHPMHAREFGSQLTNVLRCPQLEAHGYQVIVTELVGWQHSMKNERIIATRRLAENARVAGTDPAKRPKELLEEFGLGPLTQRFFLPG